MSIAQQIIEGHRYYVRWNFASKLIAFLVGTGVMLRFNESLILAMVTSVVASSLVTELIMRSYIRLSTEVMVRKSTIKRRQAMKKLEKAKKRNPYPPSDF